VQVSLGEIELEVDFAPSENETYPNLILAHPHPLMGGSMENKIILQLFRRAKARGWGCLRFNFRGVGRSSGVHDHGKGEIQDLLGLLDWLKLEKSWEFSQTILCGYSFGSWICARAAVRLENLAGLWMIAPPIKTVEFPDISQLKAPKRVFAASDDEFVSLELLETWASKNSALEDMQIFRGSDHFFVGQTVKLVDSVIKHVDELSKSRYFPHFVGD
jgi:alpha/beta superfamily hydrolase